MKSVTAPTLALRSRAADDGLARTLRAPVRRVRTAGEGDGPASVPRRLLADELDDIYASAWVGTLRALADRHAKLGDDEIRSYVLTAVANQAGKELRRRKRKPTAPLELVGAVADQTDGRRRSSRRAPSSRG